MMMASFILRPSSTDDRGVGSNLEAGILYWVILGDMLIFMFWLNVDFWLSDFHQKRRGWDDDALLYLASFHRHWQRSWFRPWRLSSEDQPVLEHKFTNQHFLSFTFTLFLLSTQCMSLNSSSQKWVFYSSRSTHLWLLFGFAIYTSSILKLLCFWWITFSLFNSFTTPPRQTLVGCSCSRWRVAWQSIEGFVELPLMSLSLSNNSPGFWFRPNKTKRICCSHASKKLKAACLCIYLLVDCVSS